MTPRSHLLLLALASALTLNQSHLLATTFSVGPTPGCSFNSLEAALSALANDPDPNPTIRLSAGLHEAVRVTIDRNVTVVGGFASCVAPSPTPGSRSILDAGQAGRVVTVRGASSGGPIAVQLANLSLEKGRADLGGGLSVTQGATVTLDNVLVLANEATVGGGGIHFEGRSNATLTLLGSGVNGNQAPIGGGILCRGPGQLIAGLGTGIGGNQAATLGGGVRATGCEVAFAGPMTVSLNTAAHGGGMFLDGGAEAELEGGPGTPLSIRQNLATSGGSSGGTGGGIAVSGEGTDLEVLNVTIERNRALHTDGSGGEGGGVMVSDHATAALAGGRNLAPNVAGGGGVSPVCPDAMSCSVFRRNEARRGAALQVGFEAEVNLINVEVVDNHAADSIIGTGVESQEAVLQIEGVYLHRNTAEVLVAAVGDTRVELTHVTTANNPVLHHAIRTARSNDRSPELRLRNNIFHDPVPVLDRGPGGLTSAECLFVADASGLEEFPAIVTEDPQLVDPVGGDLHLSPGSPAVDRCFERHFFASHDSEGHERGVLVNLGVTGDILGFDAGADELGTAEGIFSDGFESGSLSAWGVGP